MRFWDFLFGKKVKLGDEFFGEMLLMEIEDPTKDYFECERYFRPSGENIEIGIVGQLSGPTQAQKEFFEKIENEYSLIIAAIIPVIENEFKNWIPEFRIGDFRQEFKPIYLWIPSCDQQPIVWEIAFETIHDLNHHVTITMSGNNPLNILIDG